MPAILGSPEAGRQDPPSPPAEPKEREAEKTAKPKTAKPCKNREALQRLRSPED